ncbi:MAG: M23 family metallopeptidase [Thermodesulfobacteriota bacterium]|nr:M23 family metallopeptidase [Thermodesulfobacteriota bacterium]
MKAIAGRFSKVFLKMFYALLLLFYMNRPLSGDPLCDSKISINVDPICIGQGKTLIITIESKNLLKNLHGRFQNKKIDFFLMAKSSVYHYRGIFGISIKTPPDIYKIKIFFADNGEKIFLQSASIEVKKVNFPATKLSIPKVKRKLLDSDFIEDEADIIKKTLLESEERQLWDEKFIFPAKGKISSSFGAYRVYNDGSSSWHHRGIDIANKENTKIYAPNNGKIVLSRSFMVHGETIIIDHGQNIFSILCHLKRRLKKIGEYIKKGEVVGFLGQTGLSTGPHVHWSICVGEVRVDPVEWTMRKL